MKKKKLVIVIILVGIACGAYYFLWFKPSGIFYSSEEKNEEKKIVLDNRNGIYVYSEIPDEIFKVSSACTVTKYDFYIAVINSKWYSYKSSCMGTYQLEDGDVENLDIKHDSEKNEYSFMHNGKKYMKNPNIISIEPAETFVVSNQNVALDGYKLLAKETMFEGHYYSFDRYISNVGGIMHFGKSSAEQPYVLTIRGDKKINSDLIYRYSSHDIDDFPEFISFNKKLAIREKYYTGGMTNYTLKLFEFDNGVVYDLNSVFPITVNDVQLTNHQNYIYLDNNVNRHYYVMLVGYNPSFCVENSDSDNVAYYEFKIEFDYSSYSFKTPTFVRAWYEKEGCKHAKSIMGN